ncbi:MAG: hypothetical protein AUG51_19930 [Acidobacteria bacterium 13_1_20CM_3_53_8]|nr:MAG: hypothetical protein AUG51_19930 [Acidobacteria bacterium 13_1_20CM_3_53_8]
MTDKIKMLFISANPSSSGLPLLRLDKEFREISNVVDTGRPSDCIKLLVPRFAARLKDFIDALLIDRPQIIHFCGHGNRHGIVLEDDLGKSVTVDMKALADLLSCLDWDIRLIFLNSCYTQNQAELLRALSDYTIGTDQAIPDNQAITFATSFYKAFANGLSAKASMKMASTLVGMEEEYTNMSLAMLVKDGIDPNEPFVKQVKRLSLAPRPNQSKANKPVGRKIEPKRKTDKIKQWADELTRAVEDGYKLSKKKGRD